MANIIEIIYRDYIFAYKRVILIFFLIILFIIASVYAYNWYIKPQIDKPEYADVANANRREKQVDVLLFSTTWCPHCTKAKPEWDKFSSKYNGKSINGHFINCKNIDCTNTDEPEVIALIQQYNIEHYPTVKMSVDNKIIEYEASVNEKNLETFVKTILNP